jgi:hypothetical protein
VVNNNFFSFCLEVKHSPCTYTVGLPMLHMMQIAEGEAKQRNSFRVWSLWRAQSEVSILHTWGINQTYTEMIVPLLYQRCCWWYGLSSKHSLTALWYALCVCVRKIGCESKPIIPFVFPRKMKLLPLLSNTCLKKKVCTMSGVLLYWIMKLQLPHS